MEFEALSELSFEAKPLTVVAAAASAAWLCSEAFVPGVQLNREAQARVSLVTLLVQNPDKYSIPPASPKLDLATR